LYLRFFSGFEPQKIFPIAAIVSFVSSIPVGFARVQVITYAAFWLLLLCTGFFWAPIMAYLTGGLDAKELSHKLGHFNRSWMAASMLGPLIAGNLYQWNSNLSFFTVVVCYAVVIAMLYLMGCFSHGKLHSKSFINYNSKNTHKEHKHAAEDVLTASPEEPGKKLDKRLALYRYRGWINLVCASMLIGVFVNVIPLHIRDGLGHTESSAGIMLFLRCLAGFIGFTILARFHSWHFSRTWFAVVQVGAMFCVLLFLFARDNLSAFFCNCDSLRFCTRRLLYQQYFLFRSYRL
jgi:hypothetical protein